MTLKYGNRAQNYKKNSIFTIFLPKNFCISIIYSNFARFFEKIKITNI